MGFIGGDSGSGFKLINTSSQTAEFKHIWIPNVERLNPSFVLVEAKNRI